MRTRARSSSTTPRVRAGPSPIHGRGLFAVAALAPGAPAVAAFRAAAVARADEWDGALHAALGLPHDAGVHVGGGRVLYDPDVGRRGGPPHWYLMNHARPGNVRMRLLRPGGGGVEWVPTRHVAAGEELTYDYGEPDPAWCGGGGG